MFITLEGPDGSGKTSEVAPLVEFYKTKDCSCWRCASLAELKSASRCAVIMTMKTLAWIAHEIHYFWQPAPSWWLRSSYCFGRKSILCDRYADSTWHTGLQAQVDLEILRSMLDLPPDGFADLTLLLDIETEAGLRRKRRAGEWNRRMPMTSIFTAGCARVISSWLPMSPSAGW